MKARIGVVGATVATMAALLAPTAAAQTGSLDTLSSNSANPTTAIDSATEKAALDAYANLDTEAARKADPAGYDRRLSELSSSPAMTTFLNRYSVDPQGELDRLAALMDENAIDTFLTKTAGKYLVPNTDGTSGYRLVSELPPEPNKQDGPLQPAATCWKSFVGIGAFTWVTGFHCALTGVLTFPCLWIAAIAGDNINWDRYC